MTYYAAILALLLGQPAYFLERPDTTREARMALVASELAQLPPEVAAALVVQGQAESGFARYVAEGCREVPRGAPSCDRGRSRGYWQQQRAQCPGAYLYEAGTPESLHQEVACVARRWRWHLAGAGRAAGLPRGRWALYRATLAKLLTYQAARAGGANRQSVDLDHIVPHTTHRPGGSYDGIRDGQPEPVGHLPARGGR